MRTTYLVCYDITDDKRLRRVFKTCKNFGEHLQYSVFECDLSPTEKSELERVLAAGIDGIPEIERTVLSLYYHEELTLREIAQVIGLHESRVSQLKSQAILRLRTHLAERWPASRGAVKA